MSGTNCLKLSRNESVGIFHKSFQLPLIMAQCFGICPVSGITNSNYKSLQVKWLSWRVFYSLVTFIFFTVTLVLQIIKVSTVGIQDILEISTELRQNRIN